MVAITIAYTHFMLWYRISHLYIKLSCQMKIDLRLYELYVHQPILHVFSTVFDALFL